MLTKPKKFDKAVPVRLDRETLVKVEAYRFINGGAISDVVRQALTEYLKTV